MFRHLIPLALILGATVAVSVPARAQTCRVRCSASAESHPPTYREVYEYDYVSVKPAFPGGDARMIRFVNETRIYPKEAYRKGISGRVTCSFIVNADGSITNIHVLKGVEPSLNREAVRILGKMPSWTPGRLGGQCVPVRVIRTINFRK